ncbi:unnamed protein product [Schistosoma curassoni]|uniref:Uncharacterized protein n=1 Tax=Schistosoma curassoni TaxID=6186 RepID=A0A183KJ07_9TREM|nr:unnamed protein product [Schistosoma curassoni]
MEKLWKRWKRSRTWSVSSMNEEDPMATGATLGVLAILLVLFLLLLCLPWHKCDRYCSCCRCWLFSSNENIHRQSDDAFRAARMPGEYHFTDYLDLLSHKQQQMQEETTSVAAASEAVGFNMHKGKSNILRYNPACTNPIKIDGENL